MKLTPEWLDTRRITYRTSADGLITIDGDLDLTDSDITSLDQVEEVTGSVYVRASATFEAPVLTSIGGSVDVYEKATFEAPVLTSIGGYVYVRASATFEAPVLTSIGGSVYVYEKATFEAPVLTSIGEVRFNCEMFGEKIMVFDGIGAVILSEKARDGITISHCRKSAFKDGACIGEEFYVASMGDNNAHAESLKEAVEELAFKTGERDVSEYKGLPPETEKTPEEWASVYRRITGACQYGTRSFIAQRNVKAAYTLAEILEETRGAWGAEKFRAAVAA